MLSLRRKSEAKDAAIQCMQSTHSDKAIRFPAPSGSPRAYALAMTRYENGTLRCELTPGLRLLAWPIWAAAPLVQARRAPPFYPLVPSSFRP